MSPRYLTAAEAKLAVEAAGLDSSRPLDEQLSGDLEQRVSALSEQVRTLTESLEGQSEPATPEQQFAQGLASKLAEAQSPWFTTGGNDGEG